MDPVSALGAAAASAQFVGFAVKTLLGAAKFFQGLQEGPKRVVELLTWIEDELISMQRLLHPESPVFASLTTNQYVQVAPCAINARKALDKVRMVLSPLVEDIDRLKVRDDLGKKMTFLWKSLFTMKVMKDIEANLKTIQMLNATLLRELQICGFETQSLLREQSVQVLSIVIELSKRDNELLQSMKQIITLQSQTLEETKLSTAALVQTLETMRDAENHRFQELLRLQKAYAQAVHNEPRPAMSITELQTQSRTENESPLKDSEFGLDSTHIIKLKPRIQDSKSLRCKCYRNKFSSAYVFRLFAFKTASQALQVCPLHGWSGEKSYSIQANLHPWTYGSLQLSLGVLFQGRTWSISYPLKFQGTVKRSDSPIFTLFDELISSCSTRKVYTDSWKPGRLVDRLADGYVQLDWDSQKTKTRLKGVIRGIEEAVSSGIASCSDMDERGCTLLTELTLLFAYLGEEAINVENEMNRLFQIAFQSRLDPTARLRDFNDGRSYGVLWYKGPFVTLGATIINYASFVGRISPSLYELFLDYEGLIESVLSLKESPNLWRAIMSDLSLAQGMYATSSAVVTVGWHLTDQSIALGYDELSLAVISRSLESLEKIVYATSGDHSSTKSVYSPLELALGWPEGIRLLIDNNYGNHIGALDLACQIHDVKSAALLASDRKSALLIRILFPEVSDKRYVISIVDILHSAMEDNSILQLTAKELWMQKEQIKAFLLDPPSPCDNSDLRLAKSETVAKGVIYDDVYTVWSPAKLQSFDNVLSSAVHCVPGLKACHHQILYNVGFRNIDTWCEKRGTPLSFKCVVSVPPNSVGDPNPIPRVASEDVPTDIEAWGEAVLWLLERGANPTISSGYLRYHGMLVHHFLAQAQKAGMKLGKRFSKVLGYHRERDLHDKCKCLCSHMGCIPSFCFWRQLTWIGGHVKVDNQSLARRLPNIWNWSRYWRYSESDVEFIYRELCRHELFERLGMTHLCCVATDNTRNEREHVKVEDEGSAHNLRFLLRFYVLVKREYTAISTGSFWNFWWDSLDALLPPLESPTPHFRRWPWLRKFKAFQNELDISRDRKWHATLEEAGYKDWDYQYVIQDHCTKMLLKARAHRQRVTAWKQHRLVSKPRFGRRQPFKFLRKEAEEPEEDWES